MEIGEILRILRKRTGMSPEKLGDISDVSGAYIRQLESGRNKSITLVTAQKLAAGLGVKVSDLVDDGDIPPVNIRPLYLQLEELAQKVKELEKKNQKA